MNKWTQKLSSRRLVISGAVLLGMYLILILAVTNVGQTRLKESQQRELGLKVQSYANVLELFFAVTTDHINNLSTGKSIQTFYANLASGMSMEYGLGASLSKVDRELLQVIETRKVHNKPVFERILLVNYNGSIISEMGNGHITNVNTAAYNDIQDTNILIDTTSESDGVHIKLVKPVQYSGKTVGYIIAQVNKNVIIEQMTIQEYEESYSRMDLTTESGSIFIWDTISNHKNSGDLGRNIYFEVPIENTPFKLKSWFEPLAEKDVFTSRWFTIGLSLLAIPVIGGLLYIFTINNINLVLRTKVQQSQRQQKMLSIKNKRLIEEVEKRKQSEQQLAYQASHDALTGLANRKFGNDLLERELDNAAKNKTNVLIIFIDLDNFKQINDTLGHLVGDMVLVESSQRILDLIAPSATLSRFGGDEFLLIIPGLKDANDGGKIASNILALFQQSFVSKNQEFFISTSIGMAMYPQDGVTAQQLLANADTAMYKVKEEGRNAFNFYNSDMNIDVQRALKLDSRLRQAIANEVLELYYQPIVNLKTKKIIGAEALMRWEDDVYGFIPPDEFIPIAEKNGLIHQLGEFALNSACYQAAKWQEIMPLQISVNFSSVQFRYYDRVLVLIESALQSSGLSADKLDIEITESLLFDHSDGVITLLNKLQNMGAQLTIDDFGTGYSALSYLQKFPFDRLKIDRAFLINMREDEGNRELVNAIIAMAKALNLEIVAEGIEDRWHDEYLKGIDCDFGQGYYYSRPLPAKEFEQLLQKESISAWF
ncbi:putative bifunctional diguanylate cyclase/phosphodiesterase [Vibrio casei]|uniref:EAL domain-containing protein n=1 Tax=Vibrio casei TaxID=673372 RepID=A0A368LHI4_9VIBR|nr:EAL domain-containing protein [Vibrio casei]RCS70085.1 EAL domain-containing protein [Vibrio casei]SJN23861.1 Sensory box/GGDEF family protein ScrC (involved in swarmer cell regulation) [Vibrio casei]